MRLTVSLEGNAEGRVLASVDMEEIVKMTITDDIEKSNFNPQMYKSCTDTSYQCGYQQGREDMLDELVNKSFCEWTNCEDCAMWGQYDEFGEEEVCILKQLKEQNK